MIAVNMSQLTTEPTVITAGDTVSWTKSLADYPANGGWSLSYTIINATNKYIINANASGTDFLMSVAAATTAVWAAGDYSWQSRVTNGAEVYTLDIGDMTIKPSFASQVTLDNRSHAAKTLEAIEASIEGRATSATAEYEIAGRKLKYISFAEMLKLRDFYKATVMQEQASQRIAKGLPDPRRVMVRFAR